MRHFLSNLVAAVFVVGLALGLSQANATPLPLLNGLASQARPVEKAHYYGYRYRGYGYGYYPRYNYWRPYYYRPYYYGYGYRPYWNYGYWNRPYYRRYW
jgi:hypothetical protein